MCPADRARPDMCLWCATPIEKNVDAAMTGVWIDVVFGQHIAQPFHPTTHTVFLKRISVSPLVLKNADIDPSSFENDWFFRRRT